MHLKKSCNIILFVFYIILSSNNVFAQIIYALPFPNGTSVTCTRSTGHTLANELYAYDLVSNATGIKYLTVARSGCVRKIKNDGNVCGCNISYANDANYVVIDHGDGSEALYLHLEFNSVTVVVGQSVSTGDTIGIMGSTGFTCGSGAGGCGPHTHFQVQPSPSNGCTNNAATWYSTSQAISFCNVNENNGMPIGGHSYIAQNCRVELTNPIINGNVNATNLNFSWNALPNASLYRIQISTTQTFSTTIKDDNVGSATSVNYSLQPNTEYFWRVKSNLTSGWDGNDVVRRFLTIPLAPTMLSPTNNATGVSRPINFLWSTTNGALSHRLQVSENALLSLTQTEDASSLGLLVNIPASGLYPSTTYQWTGAQPSKIYYWRLRVNTAKGTSVWRGGKFTTGTTTNTTSVTVTNGYSVSIVGNKFNYAFDNQNFTVLPFDNNADVYLPTDNLTPGYHIANFYFADINNKRSGITQNTFVKVLGDSENNTMEYWYDNNFAARQAALFNDPSNIDINANTNNLSIGNHIINYRFQLQGGMWSSVHSSTFTKTTNSNSNNEKLMEYWFDNAFENRLTQLFTTSNNIDFSLNTDDLDVGPHIIYYRFKVGTEVWSSVAASAFNKQTTGSGTTVMEHWFNAEFDDRITKPITNINSVDETISTNNLPIGTNTLYTRFQKSNGYWSSVTATNFVKGETSNNGWQYQYWVDSTLGFATTLNIASTGSIDSNINVNNVDTGWHIIYSRFRRNNGLWSSVTADSFYKSTGTYQCTVTNSPSGEDSLATHFLCKYQIILDDQDGIVNQNKLKRKDLAKITYRGLVGTSTPEPITKANYLPSLFGDLQNLIPDNLPGGNAYYFNAAKFLSYITYGDGIPPFNPSRLNFHPEDTIVRGYALKVLLEAWNIKPDASLPNPYADLVPGAEVNGYVLKAAQMGLIKRPDIHGPNFTNFRPYQAVTRIEAFVMLYRLLQLNSKPDFTDDDFYIPFIKTENVGNNPSIGEGNFSSYGETPFTIKGVPSLSFSFNYNAASTEVPDEGVKGKDENGNIVYDQQNIGVGWNHNYNNYILVDTGITASNADNRYLLMWSSGNVQVFNPNTNNYVTKGVYDTLTKDAFNPTVITIKTKSQISYRFEKLVGVSGNILHLVSVKDRHNNTVSLTYENGYSATAAVIIKRLKVVDDSHNRKIEFAYLPTTNLLDSVSANAGSLHKVVRFDYIARRLTKYTNPKNDFSIYNYSALPGQEYLITKIVMPKGNIITNKYNKNNKLTSTQLNNTQQTLIETNPTFTATNSSTNIKIKTVLNGITQQQNIKNNQYSMPVDAEGLNYKNGIEYNDAANVLLPTKVTDSLTNVEVVPVYSSNGNLLSITKQGGAINITETMQYNSYNDITQKIDGNNNITTFTYNMPQGQLIQINAPNGVTTRIFPNANGTIDSMLNPSLIGTKYNYDTYGNLVQTKLPLNIISQVQNDAYGKLLKSLNPNNIGTNYLYDANDNMMKESFDTTGLNIITQYRFDKNDNLIEVENANGNITYLTYNNNDQLVKEQFGAAIKKYEYSDDGRVKKFINPNGISFLNTFNEKDLLVNDGYATYNYYVDNSLQSINKNGKAITYTYDALKRIKTVNYNDFANNTVSYDYDNNSNIIKITYPNGIAVNYEYDANNRLVKVKDAANLPWATYTYLLDGRLNTQTNRNGTIVKYFYDAAARMDSMVTTKANGIIIAAYGFELDKLGNHKKESFNQPFSQSAPVLNDSITYTYNNVNRLLSKNTDSYGYDNNGNLTGITKSTGGINYIYDIKNNLLQYNENGNAITYEYDGLGQRRKRNNTRYVLDNAYNVLMETDANGIPQYYYIHGLGMIARVKAVNSQPYYYHHDFRGSTVAITNSSQTITHKYQYGAFGETQQVQEEDFNAYRYVGKYGVGYETKDLTFMRARYYQPSVGRFNSEDPVWGVNLYPYGDNSPITLIDINGNASIAPSYTQFQEATTKYNMVQNKKDLDILQKYNSASQIVSKINSLRKMQLSLSNQIQNNLTVIANLSKSALTKLDFKSKLLHRNDIFAEIRKGEIDDQVQTIKNDIKNLQYKNLALVSQRTGYGVSINSLRSDWTNLFENDLNIWSIEEFKN